MTGVSYDGAEFLNLVRLYWGAPSRRLPGVCWVCEVLLPSAAMVARFESPTAERARCVHVSGGIVDAHHLVPRRVIKGVAQGGKVRLPGLEGPACRTGQVIYGLGTVLMDPRNAILVRRYHHDALEHGTLAIPKVLWPEEALAFARELDLEYWIDNKEAKRA